jgi:hypothetical protein
MGPNWGLQVVFPGYTNEKVPRRVQPGKKRLGNKDQRHDRTLGREFVRS